MLASMHAVISCTCPSLKSGKALVLRLLKSFADLPSHVILVIKIVSDVSHSKKWQVKFIYWLESHVSIKDSYKFVVISKKRWGWCSFASCLSVQ